MKTLFTIGLTAVLVLLLAAYGGTTSEPTPVAPGEPEPSYLDELERLAALRDQGGISDDEFAAKKRQLLNL